MNNYLKIAIRNLLKHRLTSFINLFGLTVGLTCCLLILVYIVNELSYDRYNKNADRTYRITRAFYSDNGSLAFNLGALAPAFGPLLQNDFPDIEKMTRLYSTGGTFKYEDNNFNENNAYFADPYLFDVFTINTVKGNPQKALSEPYSLMMTEEIAKKYFGNDDPLNKVIRLNNQYDMKVTGVYKSFPNASHVHPDILISFATLNDSTIYGAKTLATSFSNNSFFTYILLSENYPVEKLQASLPQFIDRHLGDVYESTPSKRTALNLQRLTDIHLYSHLDSELEVNGDISRVYIFSAIALFILLIAAINYMNLSTARSSLRAREIGVRKVVGAQRSQLIIQFIGESVLLTFMAMIFALLMAWILIPSLSHLSGQQLSLSNLFNWKMM
ncbi:MAG TPA: ABC transporter permease, partial [Chitinophagales bacterium]|nr:ABC transporter permease [Chitinophagales bacterium]